MAPINAKCNRKERLQSNGGKPKKTFNTPGFMKKKRKWVPENNVFAGSVQEGQGFALKRKQKVQHEYNKLLRKDRNRRVGGMNFKNEYPEHLKHLYEAEEEKLKEEEELNKRKRRSNASVSEDDACSSAHAQSPTSAPSRSLPERSQMRKKTSYQKAKEEYERVREKRRNKKEAALRNKQQREEALRVYQEKKRQAFQMLSKKTKKGQPNLNVQMDYLLLKIQEQRK